jgi:hypothetical protein
MSATSLGSREIAFLEICVVIQVPSTYVALTSSETHILFDNASVAQCNTHVVSNYRVVLHPFLFRFVLTHSTK